MTISRISVVAIVLLAFVAGLADAQPSDNRLLRWNIDVRGGRTTAEPRTYRFFEEIEEIQLRLGMSHDSKTALVVDRETLQRSLRLTVTSGGRSLETNVEWQPSVQHSGQTFRTPLSGPSSGVRIEGDGGVRWFLGIRRSDGELFTPGMYTVAISMKLAPAAFRTPEGAPWVGPWGIPSETDLTVVVNRPASTQERVLQALTEGSVAGFDDGNWNAAAAAYRRAVALDPGNDDAKFMLASSYLRLKRYREAIPFFEDILPRRGGPRGVGGALVHAYMGAGDEANAARVLRAEGFNNEQVAAKISEVRRGLQRSR
jgi:hypothetical protein